MEALDALKREHDVIERVLDLLEQSVSRIDAGRPVPDGFGPWAVRFFREFADRCHHGKEEDVLFPLLEQRGLPREGGPIGVMLNEHDIGRDCVARMDRAASASASDDAEFAAAAREYVPLLRQHIFKENNILFQMARQRLSDEDAANTLAKFHEVEKETGGKAFHERYEAETGGWEKTFAG